MKSVIGLNLKDIYYNFNFKNPLGKFEKFITESCVKLPTGKLSRTMIIESYEKCHKITDNSLKKKIGNDLSLFLDKYFFKDYFQDGISSYVGWYGITTKENILKGTGITSSLHNKHQIYKINKDNPDEIVQEWESQVAAGKSLGIKPTTIGYRIKSKSIFDNFYLIKASDFKKKKVIEI